MKKAIYTKFLTPSAKTAIQEITQPSRFSDRQISMPPASHADSLALSGGCFRNRILLEGSFQALRAEGFEVYHHTTVPTNDGGISLGQAVCAAAIAQAGDAYVSGQGNRFRATTWTLIWDSPEYRSPSGDHMFPGSFDTIDGSQRCGFSYKP